MTPERAVLLTGNFLSTSVGSRGVCEELATRLSAAGWRVITASSKRNRVARLADMVATAWGRRGQYAVAQIDVFSGPAFAWAEAVAWTLRRAHKPFVLTLHGGNLPQFAHRWPGRVRHLLEAAAVVTTPSRYLLEAMQSYRAELELLPNALDLEAYPFRLRQAVRPRLVWLRAFNAIYNPALVSRVIARLTGELPDVAATMIGPDKGDGSLAHTQQTAAELGVAERISYAGRVTKADVPGHLARGDIFLNTADIDNAPVSVVEAMACGLPVVSTNVGGIGHLLRDRVDALLVPPDAPAAMADAVRRLVDDPALAARLSAAGRDATMGRDWANLLPCWERLLSAVAERGRYG